jgi:2-polyprenyl-3-methyl-5-hydroxy-6-metoxy-1,4-benzoquinol methylase
VPKETKSLLGDLDMTLRIPHKNDVIADGSAVEAYVKNHRHLEDVHFKAFLKEFDQLGIKGKYLEVGSGPGLLTALIAQKNPEARITALEPSARMIEFARRHAENQGVEDRIDFVCGSVDDGRLMDSLGRFDLVYSTFSLHHWEKPNTAWRYLLSSVKKKGTLFVHDLKRVSWLYYLPFKNGLFESIRAAYNCVEIGRMLRSMGIEDYKLKTPFPYFWMSILVQN